MEEAISIIGYVIGCVILLVIANTVVNKFPIITENKKKKDEII
jgi:hypothetical protein